MALDIQLQLAQQVFAVGETIPFSVIVSNTGEQPVPIIDPRQGGTYFRLRLQVTPEEWRIVSMKEVLSAPGVPTIVKQTTVPAADRRIFDFDLTTLTPMDQPGNYVLVVEYEVQPGVPWRSLPTPFSVVQRPTGRMAIIPNEALRAGYHGLCWLQSDGAQARAYLMNFQINQLTPPLEGAVEVASVPPRAMVTLSMAPAAQPFPDRWVVWAAGDRVFYSYWARAAEERLPAGTINFAGFQPEIIQPPLATAPPDEGRPGCLIGLLLRSSSGACAVVPVEIYSDGQYRISPAQRLNGDVRGAWATAPSPVQRIFVFALQSGPTLQIASVSRQLGADSEMPVSWFTLEAEFLAGDVRTASDRSVRVGLLVKRGEAWERHCFTPLPGMPPEPIITTVDPGPPETPAAAVRVRLDSNGELHTLFSREKALHYVPPKATAETWSHQRPIANGNSHDILIAPYGRAALTYYDLERGPTFIKV